MAKRPFSRGDEPEQAETNTEDQRQVQEQDQQEDAPQPRERDNADDVEEQQGNVDEQMREGTPGETEADKVAEEDPAVKAQREQSERSAKLNEESRSAILKDQGLEGDKGVRRLTRERGYDPDLPLVSHTEAWETGYAGQVPDRTPNEAYQAGGDETEAARADLRAASLGRLGNDE